MYTQQLGHIIQQLLRQHPMVILPGLGGLVVERIPARLDAHRGRMVPPSSSIVFNAQLKHNDGLLAQSVAAHWGFSLTEADNWLTDAITELRFSLTKGETVQWSGIGALKHNFEGRIHFTPDSTGVLLPESFGLRPLQLTEVHHERDLKVRTLEVARTIPARKIAAYASAAMVAGLMVWLPFQQGVMDSGKHLVAEMGITSFASEQAYQPRMFQPLWEMQEQTVADAAEVIVPIADSPEPTATTTEATTVAYPTRFHVVAASFADKGAADAHLSKLQQRGFGAEYAGVDAAGVHLVAYGTYSSMSDAEAMLASVSLSNKVARIVPAN